jgi:hypothetical protein
VLKGASRSIFRPEAIQRYIEGKEKAVLPRLVAPAIFAYLWVLMLLLLAGAFVAWLTRVPVFVTGPGMVLESNEAGISPERGKLGGSTLLVAAFLPAENHSSLRVGQAAFGKIGTPPEAGSVPIFQGLVIAIEPEVLSVESIQRRFPMAAALELQQPSAVAIIRTSGTAPVFGEPKAGAVPTASGLPVSTYAGSRFSVNIEVGRRSAISYLGANRSDERNHR